MFETVVLNEELLGFHIHNEDQQLIKKCRIQYINISILAAIQYANQDFITLLQTTDLCFNFHMKFRFFITSSSCLFHRRDIFNSCVKHYQFTCNSLKNSS